MSEKNGFSLVEIIVVLVLLTILSAIVAKIYSGYVESSKRKMVMFKVSMCAMAIQNNCKLKGTFNTEIPECNTDNTDWPKEATLSIDGDRCESFNVFGEYKSFSYCCIYSNNDIDCKKSSCDQN